MLVESDAEKRKANKSRGSKIVSQDNTMIKDEADENFTDDTKKGASNILV